MMEYRGRYEAMIACNIHDRKERSGAVSPLSNVPLR